ncbi:MAG: hypothetical protein HPY61_14480 [Methanotrichaceae archaeon]|nr:hypothetical protein [Methanotrichaceae archaeon]
MTPSITVVSSFAVIFLFVATAATADDYKQLSLSVYVDEDLSKALVAGYICDPSGLSFLNSSERIYEQDTGMLYAVTDSLVKSQGQSWDIAFPLSGYYDEYHAIFYIPGGAELKEMDCSQGLVFLSSNYNDSLVLNVHGFDITDPEVNIRFSIS